MYLNIENISAQPRSGYLLIFESVMLWLLSHFYQDSLYQSLSWTISHRSTPINYFTFEWRYVVLLRKYHQSCVWRTKIFHPRWDAKRYPDLRWAVLHLHSKKYKAQSQKLLSRILKWNSCRHVILGKIDVIYLPHYFGHNPYRLPFPESHYYTVSKHMSIDYVYQSI